MIVLVTGSREFTDRALIKATLLKAVEGHQGPHTLIHGGAAGADRLAGYVATKLKWAVRVVDADWEGPCRPACKPGHRRPNKKTGRPTVCPAAGVYRNQLMVDEAAAAMAAGAEVRCVPFYARGAKNHGTTDCVQRAGAAQIPIVRNPE